jgi:hypothetical protein
MLLAYVEFPEAFLPQPDAAVAIAGLDAQDLQRILGAAMDAVPGFEAWLASQLPALAAQSAPGLPAAGARAASPAGAAETAALATSRPPRRTLVDTRPIEGELRRALQSANPHDWRHGVDAPTVLEPTVERARGFLQHGDGANALAILEIVYAETIPNYDWLEGECELADFLTYTVAPLVTEAILLGDIDREHKTELKERMDEWRAGLAAYGVDEAFDLPLQARSHDEQLAAMVADAALSHRPTWVIRTGTRLAEGHIAKVKSAAYASALVWLKRVKQAHTAAGTGAEWVTYLRELKARHSRKRALLDLLEGL